MKWSEVSVGVLSLDVASFYDLLCGKLYRKVFIEYGIFYSLFCLYFCLIVLLSLKVQLVLFKFVCSLFIPLP